MREDKSYYYILIDYALYINVNLGILELFVMLLIHGKPFTCFDRITRSRLLNVLPRPIIRTFRILLFSYAFIQKKRRLSVQGDCRIVNKNGHCLLMLRQGEMKVFDLKNKEVTTLFPINISASEINQKVKLAEEVSICKLAPPLVRWNAKERYLTEKYVNLYRPYYHLNKVNKLSYEVFPVLESIMMTTEPALKNLKDYTKNLEELFISKCKELYVLYQDEQSRLESLHHFFVSKLQLIEEADPEQQIPVVFSHGDLWEGNLLGKGKRCSVIDWNTKGQRSCYFDFFFFLFMLSIKNSHFDKVDPNGISQLSQVMSICFSRYYSSLIQKVNIRDNVTGLTNFNLFRQLFYMELVILKLCAVEHREQMDEVITWVKRFKSYETCLNT